MDKDRAEEPKKMASRSKIHNCQECFLPIRFYGRLHPCKHVFCHACANKMKTRCSKCHRATTRVEKLHHGHISVCTVGVSSGLGGSTRCNRGYPSKRDLHSHVQRCHPDQSSGQGQPAVVKMLWLGNLVSPANGSDESPPGPTDTESSEDDYSFQCEATMPAPEHNHDYTTQPQHPILNCPWMQMPPPVMPPFYPLRFGHALEDHQL